MSLMLLADLGTWFKYILGPLMLLVSLFLMLLILIQRGKGGGLSGAFGGAGGQSAFGARAGDTIMWVTVWVTIAWLLLCLFCVKLVNHDAEWADPNRPSSNLPAVNTDETSESVDPPATGAAAPGAGGVMAQPPAEGGAAGETPAAGTSTETPAPASE